MLVQYLGLSLGMHLQNYHATTSLWRAHRQCLPIAQVGNVIIVDQVGLSQVHLEHLTEADQESEEDD